MFSPDQIQHLFQLVRASGQLAQRMAKEQFQVYQKGIDDYVTTVDRTLDRQLTAGFATLFPADGIITEENADSWQQFQAGLSRLWCIDPLDGTDDFIQGSPYYAVMAGLLEAQQPVAGWVYAPEFDQLYYGGLGWGVFETKGDRPPLAVTLTEPAPPASDFCPILIGPKDRRRFGNAIGRHIPAAQFSYIGSFGLKVLQVITGKAGLYIYLNNRVKLWDTTGPLALAKAAGLVCCDLDGQPIAFTSDAVDAKTLIHQQPMIIGWSRYVEALRPHLQTAVMECEG